MVNGLRARSRIAYLISCYPAVSHTFILREIQELQRLGISIAVASINPPNIEEEKLSNQERQERERTYYVKKTPLFQAVQAFFRTLCAFPLGLLKGFCFALFLGGMDPKRCFYHFFYFLEAILIGDWMDKEEVSHLHVHFATPASTVALILSKIRPITYSLSVHGPDEFYDISLYHLEQKLLCARFIFCISWYTKSQLMRLCTPDVWKKLHVIPLGIDPEIFHRSVSSSSEKHQLLCVSRLSRTKGLYVLLKAIQMLAAKRQDFHLILVGEGPEGAELRQFVRQNQLENLVTFTGALNQAEVLKHYRKASLFVLPSFGEGLPVVLMEAMAMEIPCITTWINGIPELISDGESGLLVSPGNVDALCKGIEILLNHPELREKIGNNGRKRVIDEYHLRKNIQRQEEIFRHYLFFSEIC